MGGVVENSRVCNEVFIDLLYQDGSIPVHLIKWRGQLQRFVRLQEKIQTLTPDDVVSFLEVSSLLYTFGACYKGDTN